MSQIKSILFSSKSRLTVLLVIISMVMVACDTVAPEEEEIAFEGAPEVTIASPLAGDTYNEGVGVNILLRVDNAGEDVARIAIEVDGQIIGEAILPNPNGDASFTVNNGWPASGAGEHIITAIASRSDGTVSEEASVTINVVASEVTEPETSDDSDTVDNSDDAEPTEDSKGDSQTDDSQGQETDSTPIPSPTDAPVAATAVPAEPTDVPAPTDVPPTNTPARPQVRITTGANIRSGPGVVFDPPIGSLAAGATANILAVNTAGTWYKIEYYNGDGWVSSLVAEVTGDISGLPREAGPATPIPATATPVVPTATVTPSTAPDLSATAVVVGPHPFVCNEASEVRITVANSGNAASAGTSVVVADLFNGQVTGSSNAPIPALEPGANHTAVIFLTVSTNFGEAHVTRVTVDPDNQVAESNESNNVRNEDPYVLATGSC